MEEPKGKMQWLKEKTDDDLLDMSYNVDGVKVFAASGEMSRRLKDSIDKLNVSVGLLSKSTSFYSKIMIILTIVIVVMTGISIYITFIK
jgi:hypothetical protein